MVASYPLRSLLRCQVRRLLQIAAVKRRCLPCDTRTATGPLTCWEVYWATAGAVKLLPAYLRIIH